MPTNILDKLLYEDDMAKHAKTETKMERALARMSQECNNYELRQR